MKKVDIFEFKDPIEYFQATLDYLKFLRKINIHDWAQMMGLKNASKLVALLNRKQKLQIKHLEFLKKGLNLSPVEREFLVYLILFNNSSSEEERKTFERLMLETKISYQEDSFVVDDKVAAKLSSHLDYAILALLMSENLKLEKANLTKDLFLFPVTQEEIDFTVAKLLTFGLIVEGGGFFKACSNRVKTEADVSVDGIRRYYNEVIDLAKLSVDMDVSERELQCFSFAIDQSTLDAYKEEFRKFRRRIEHLGNSQNSDTLFQCNLQLFPLSKRMNSPYAFEKVETNAIGLRN